MSEAMSTCASCGRKFPTAPPDHVHKCVCGGKMVPDPAPLGMSGGVPAGWVLVPATPTKAMIEAGKEAGMWDDGELTFARHVYESMIAATPTPPIEGRDADVEQLKQALEDVCNPLAYLKRMAEAEGAKLGGMAYSIANDIATVQGIARAALQALGERP